MVEKGFQDMANQNERKREKMFLIHSLIGVGIMVFFRFLPLNLPEVTSIGMEVLGIFIGTLYLWTFVDPLWGSLMSIAMVGLSNYMPMAGLLKEAFAAPVVAQVFFLLIMAGGLVYYKITLYIAFGSGSGTKMSVTISFFLSVVRRTPAFDNFQTISLSSM